MLGGRQICVMFEFTPKSSRSKLGFRRSKLPRLPCYVAESSSMPRSGMLVCYGSLVVLRSYPSRRIARDVDITVNVLQAVNNLRCLARAQFLSYLR